MIHLFTPEVLHLETEGRYKLDTKSKRGVGGKIKINKQTTN